SIEAHLASVRQRDGNSGRPFAELQVEAVVELVSTGGSTSANRRLPEIEVLIDWSTLVDGIHPTTVCETVDGIPLPIQTVQRLCCEADVLPVVLRSSGEVLHVGRTARVATRAQRRALAALHRTCAHPHCQAAFSRCQIHHVIPWERGGRTDLDNLIPLCTEHHHLVHEGGWSLQLHKDRTITLNRPDGTRSFSGRTTDRLLVDSQRSH
ncbi:MAG: HNH endonuclease, partial [Ilumatobacteraceae bacterium]